MSVLVALSFDKITEDLLFVALIPHAIFGLFERKEIGDSSIVSNFASIRDHLFQIFRSFLFEDQSILCEVDFFFFERECI